MDRTAGFQSRANGETAFTVPGLAFKYGPEELGELSDDAKLPGASLVALFTDVDIAAAWPRSATPRTTSPAWWLAPRPSSACFRGAARRWRGRLAILYKDA